MDDKTKEVAKALRDIEQAFDLLAGAVARLADLIELEYGDD